MYFAGAAMIVTHESMGVAILQKASMLIDLSLTVCASRQQKGSMRCCSTPPLGPGHPLTQSEYCAGYAIDTKTLIKASQYHHEHRNII